MGGHAVGPAVMDRPHLDVDGLEAAEGALGVRELLVGLDSGGGVEGRGLEAGAQHIDAVERGFGIDLRGVARKRHVVIRDGDVEVLGDFVLVDHGADRKPDLVLAARRPFGAALRLLLVS